MNNKKLKTKKTSGIGTTAFFLLFSIAICYATLLYLQPKRNSLYTEIPSAGNKSEEKNFGQKQRHKVAFNWDHKSKQNSSLSKPDTATVEKIEKEKTTDSNTQKQLKEAFDLVDTGHPEEAQKILEDILSKNPNNEEALEELGYIYLIDYKDTAQAQDYFEKVLRVNNNNKLVISDLISIYEKRDQLDSGIGFFETLQSSSPDDPTMNLALGELHEANKNQDKAMSHFIDAANKSLQAKDQMIVAQKFSKFGHDDKAVEYYEKTEQMAAEGLKKNSNGKPNIQDRSLLSFSLYKQYEIYKNNGNTEKAEKIKEKIQNMSNKNQNQVNLN